MTLSSPKHPPLTVDALVKWLRTQNPDQEYIWSDPAFCMMGKYLAENDSAWGAVSYSELPNYELIAATKPWTFGAALERAEKLLALPAPSPAPNEEFLLPAEPLLHALPEIELGVPERVDLKALPAPITSEISETSAS